MNGRPIALVMAGLALSACSSPPANQFIGASTTRASHSNSSRAASTHSGSSGSGTSSATADLGFRLDDVEWHRNGQHGFDVQRRPPPARLSARGLYPVQSKPFAVAVADFNGDGALNLAIANNGSGR